MNKHHFKKRYGQNFLSDEKLLSAIAEDAQITKNDTVLEIGAGGGALTSQLAKRAKKVIAYEIDKELIAVLTQNLRGIDNIELIFNDFMMSDMTALEERLGENYIVAANLPYYISTPVVMRFVEEAKKIKSLTLTLQKEVGERLAAKEGTRDYGTVSVFLTALADVKITRYIDRSFFYPQPNVDSVVIKADFVGNKFGINDFDNFRKLVKSAFGMRRKTLVNNLMASYKVSREKAINWLQSFNITPTIRGEELSALQFALLSNNISLLNMP